MIKNIFILIIISFIFSQNSFSQVLTLEERIDSVLDLMTLDEKIAQLTGWDVMKTGDNGRLKIPGFYMSDGPHGIRDQDATSWPAPPEALATSFPVSVGVAATWDKDLAKRYGNVMAKEFKGKYHNKLLGPALYICNDPRNGRSAESFGEDPYLCAIMGNAMVEGIQSTGCIATIKSYICENGQDTRLTDTIKINRRMLMEHWSYPFRYAIQQGNSFSIMSAYVAVNGQKASHSYDLNTTVLRKMWGYPYYMVSDWGSVFETKPAIIAGCDLCMGSPHYEYELKPLVQNNQISENLINQAVRNILRTKFVSGLMDNFPLGNPDDLNSPASQQMCYETAQKSLVLLKNENDILPINASTINSVALIGPSAATWQLDGNGSSWVFPFYAVTPKEAFEAKLGTWKVKYAMGCDINSDDTTGFAAARQKAASADYVIFVGGLDHTQEGETSDRVDGSIELPGKQQALINAVAQVNPNIIVIIESGGICSMSSCIDNIDGLVYAFYPGQEGGNVIADVVLGNINPSGKLPVSMPVSDYQMPERNINFNDDYGSGYRWYDAMDYTPQFAFGFGLSYTTFQYSNITISSNTINKGENITITADITNTGTIAGDEVAQLYLIDDVATMDMPEKQLKGFQRISLEPSETKTVSFVLNAEDFYYFDSISNRFAIEPGSFTVKVGGASDSLPLSASFEVLNTPDKPDLLITNVLTIPAYPQQGDTVIFLAMIKNNGTAATAMGETISVNFSIDGSQKAVSATFSDSLAPGSVKLICSDVGINYWIPPVNDTFLLGAYIDPDNSFDENIETNNQMERDLYVGNPNDDDIIPNIALDKPIVASSEDMGQEFFANYANDGYLTTRWSSDWQDYQYFTIDLLNKYQVSKVKIMWEAAFASDYEVLYSEDSIVWDTLIHIIDGDEEDDEFITNFEARYLRLNCNQRGTPYGFSLYEFQAFGVLADSVVTPVYNQEKNSKVAVYPNPFNSFVNIIYSMPESNDVFIDIVDMQGKRITILKNKHEQIGNHAIRWYATNHAGEKMPEGLYFCRIKIGNAIYTKKIVLTK